MTSPWDDGEVGNCYSYSNTGGRECPKGKAYPWRHASPVNGLYPQAGKESPVKGVYENVIPNAWGRLYLRTVDGIQAPEKLYVTFENKVPWGQGDNIDYYYGKWVKKGEQKERAKKDPNRY